MWRTRKTWLILLLSVGLLGAYWGVSAQEGRNPLTPRPVQPPPDDDLSKGKPTAKGKAELPYAPVIPVGGQYPVENPAMPVLPVLKQNAVPPPLPVVPGTLVPLPETKGNVAPPLPFGQSPSLPTPPALPVAPPIAPMPETKNPFALPPIAPQPETKGPQPLTMPIDPKQPVAAPEIITLPPQPKGNGPLIVSPETPVEPKRDAVQLLDPSKTNFNPPTTANKIAPTPEVAPLPKLPQVEDRSPKPQPQPVVQTPVVQPPVIQQPVVQMPVVQTPVQPPQPVVMQDKRPKSFILVRPAVKGDGLPVPNIRINEKEPVVCHANRKEMMQNSLVLPPNPPLVVPSTQGDNSLIKPFIGNDPGGSILLSMQTPQLIVEKRGPAMLRQGEPLHYQIVVKNVGATPANNVRVEDEIPSDTRIVSSDPAPALQGGKATWTIVAIPPGTERAVSITLQSNTFSELANNTSVHVSAAAGARPRAMGGEPLSIRVAGPLTATVGEQPVFEVRYANQTSQVVRGLMLHGTLSEGLSRPEGRLFEGEVGELPANGSKTIKLPVSAMAPGRHVVEMKITAAGGLQATASAIIEVQPAAIAPAIAPVSHSTSNFVAPAPVVPALATTGGVVVTQSPITRLIAGREGDLRIEVTNNTGKPLRNVRIVEALPESLEFTGASDRGMFQSSSRSAHWFLENLAASQSVSLTLRVNPRMAGTFSTEIAVQPEGASETKSSSSVVVEGFSDLQVRMAARDNPLETGKETIYEIQVANSGAAPATGVQLEVTLPDGLIPREAKGPTRHLSNQSQTVRFEKLPTLAPQSQVTYRITAFAHTPGNHRVRVSLASDQSRTPLVREQNLLVYDPSR